jgi:hypothetical protein
MSLSHLLYESASGYAIFSVSLHDEVANSTKQFQDSIADLHKFGQMVQLKSFAPFTSAAHALENANDVSEGELASFFSCAKKRSSWSEEGRREEKGKRAQAGLPLSETPPSDIFVLLFATLLAALGS